MMRPRNTFHATALALVCTTWVVHAQAPQWIPVQGTLFTEGGAPVSDTVTMVFGLYTASTGGTVLWEEGRNVEIDRGHFTVFLGESTPLDLAIFRDNPETFLSVKIDGEEARFPLGSVPYAGFAMHAGNAETLGGVEPSGFATTAHEHAPGSLECMTVMETVERDPFSPSVFSSIVECPEGYIATGGGFSSTPAFAPGWAATTSTPRDQDNGWQCLARTDGAEQRELICVARCCRIAP